MISKLRGGLFKLGDNVENKSATGELSPDKYDEYVVLEQGYGVEKMLQSLDARC